MDKKQQFIEKSLKGFEKRFIADITAYESVIFMTNFTYGDLMTFLQSKLSECWDMAGEELIDKVDLEIEAWMGANQNLDREFTTNEMMKHLRNTALTSQKEGKTE